VDGLGDTSRSVRPSKLRAEVVMKIGVSSQRVSRAGPRGRFKKHKDSSIPV